MNSNDQNFTHVREGQPTMVDITGKSANRRTAVAEARMSEALPTATLCYVWDPSWPKGTVVLNAYTRRVRFITLGTTPGRWEAERRELATDFLRAFGDEARTVPPLLAIAVGADADNTAGHSLGWVDALQHEPPLNRP